MASSFPSFDNFGSPVNPGSSMIHLCMSVKRTVSGSTPGCFSASWMPISSALSQSNVFGIPFRSWMQMFPRRLDVAAAAQSRKFLVLGFLRVILVPLRNLDHDVLGAVRHTLAAEARFRRHTRRFVQLVQLRVGGFVATIETLVHDHVARGAGAHASAGVVQADVIALRNIQDAARQAVVAVGNFFGINFDSLPFPDKRDLIFLRRGRELCFFNIWILAAHAVLLLSQRAHHKTRTVERQFTKLKMSSRAGPSEAARSLARCPIRRPAACLRKPFAARRSSALRRGALWP